MKKTPRPFVTFDFAVMLASAEAALPAVLADLASPGARRSVFAVWDQIHAWERVRASAGPSADERARLDALRAELRAAWELVRTDRDFGFPSAPR